MSAESIETLQSDLKTCVASLDALGPLASVQDVVAHLKMSVYPMIENVVTEVVEIDQITESLLNNAEDILQPETAQVFAGVLVGGAALCLELEKRLTLPADAKLLAGIKEWRALAQQAGAVLDEITVVVEDEEDEDEEEDEEDEDEDVAEEGTAQ